MTILSAENQKTREHRKAELKADGLWHLTAGKDLLIYDIAYAPRKTREEAQAWVNEVLRDPEDTNHWTTRASGLVVPRGSCD